MHWTPWIRRLRAADTEHRKPFANAPSPFGFGGYQDICCVNDMFAAVMRAFHALTVCPHRAAGEAAVIHGIAAHRNHKSQELESGGLRERCTTNISRPRFSMSGIR